MGTVVAGGQSCGPVCTAWPFLHPTFPVTGKASGVTSGLGFSGACAWCVTCPARHGPGSLQLFPLWDEAAMSDVQVSGCPRTGVVRT